jgi:cell division septum initiation protein DivIVA
MVEAHTGRQSKEIDCGGIMLSFEDGSDDLVTSTSVADGPGQIDEPETGLTAHQDRPADAAARMLELAATTADQLVVNAQTEAAGLVTTAQAQADAILQASRNQAHHVATELSRTKDEQTAELDRERATALAGLAEERAALQAQIDRLHQMQSDHRTEMRRHLTEQLALLDAKLPEPPTADAD